jgi:hypothetical protein
MAAPDGAEPTIEPVTPPEMMKLLNGVTNALLASPLGKRLGGRLMTLEFEGRKSHKMYRLPVGRQELLDKLSVLTKRKWRLNFRGGADARARLDGRWQPVHGLLVEDADTIARAYQEGIERFGRSNTRNTIGIKINVDRDPTLDELREYVSAYGWYLIQFDVLGAEN